MEKAGIDYLVSAVRYELPIVCGRKRLALRPEQVVLAVLSYLAGNTFQIKVGRKKHKCLGVKKLFCIIMANKMSNYVKFPTNTNADERRSVRLDFFAIAGFPGLVSGIDGTHIAIVAPQWMPANIGAERVIVPSMCKLL